MSTEQHIVAFNLRFEGASFKAIGKKLNVSDKTAKRWVDLGEQALNEMNKKEKPKSRKEYDEKTVSKVLSLRDDEEQSWKSIADRLHLGSPGTARRIYRSATGRDRNEPLGRLPGKGGRLPGGKMEWVVDENCGGCSNGEPCKTDENGDPVYCKVQVQV